MLAKRSLIEDLFLMSTAPKWVPIWGPGSPFGDLGPHGDLFQSLGPHRVPLGPHFLFLGFRTREKSVQPPSNVDYLITCSPNLKLFTASPPSKTLSWKQCKWQHILEKVSFREKFQLKQSVKGSDFAAVHILLRQAILLLTSLPLG